MENLDFLLTCLISITFVFAVLFILSLSIQLLIIIFPDKTKEDDSVVINAINNHYSKTYPHLRITKIEEQK
jgi:uncharacterized membrane protein YqjE